MCVRHFAVICGTEHTAEAVEIVLLGFNAVRRIVDDEVYCLVEFDIEKFNLKVIVGLSGPGKVNASSMTSVLIRMFDVDLILVCGLAGSLHSEIDIGDVVIVTHAVAHDYGALCSGLMVWYPSGRLPIGGAPNPNEMPLRMPLHLSIENAVKEYTTKYSEYIFKGRKRGPKALFGRTVSGDQFINCNLTKESLRSTFNADVVDMDAVAVIDVAERYGIPTVSILSVCDSAGHDSHIDYSNLAIAVGSSAAVVLEKYMEELVKTNFSDLVLLKSHATSRKAVWGNVSI